MKAFCSLLLCFMHIVSSWAQIEPYGKLGLGFGRYGFAFNYENTSKQKWNNHVKWELGNIMNIEEIAIINGTMQGRTGVYKFEKTNYAWALRAMVGKQWNVAHLSNVGLVPYLKANVGVSMAYSWPVYINYLEVDTVNSTYKTETVRYNPQVHKQVNIAERASFAQGFGKGKLMPGLRAELALDMRSIGRSGELKSIEVGVYAEWFLGSKLPLYYETARNKSFYSSFFINFALGN